MKDELHSNQWPSGDNTADETNREASVLPHIHEPTHTDSSTQTKEQTIVVEDLLIELLAAWLTVRSVGIKRK